MPGEVTPIFSLPPDLTLGKLEPTTAAESSGFAELLDAQVGEVNENLMAAEETLQDFAVGEERSIHHVLMSMEKAKLSFSLMVQVRNRVLEAYQDVMRMQI
jgi:flagellar hook-basal body complex protein FliE